MCRVETSEHYSSLLYSYHCPDNMSAAVSCPAHVSAHDEDTCSSLAIQTVQHAPQVLDWAPELERPGKGVAHADVSV